MMREFKVGDRVKFELNSTGNMFRGEGTVVRVLRYNSNGNLFPYPYDVMPDWDKTEMLLLGTQTRLPAADPTFPFAEDEVSAVDDDEESDDE
jgi:hypothetical protein